MPWKIDPQDGKFVVRKLNDDGSMGAAVGKPHSTRAEALAHLKALYSNVPDATASEQGDMQTSNLMSGAIHFEADTLNPRLLHFKDVVLARPETNKNRDAIDRAGIQELADTIAGMPIDYNHDSKRNVGFYTAGRVGADGELRVDGAIWLDRCEENGVDPQEVLDGLYGMSIEADAATAECSICHKIHTNANEYCEHLKIQGDDQGYRSKIKHGSIRIMRGLRSLGGAFTKKPAGSKTGWDAMSGIALVASHLEVSMTENELTASEIAELWVNEIAAAIQRREDVSDADKKRAEKEYGDVRYADEKNKKYPLDEKHIHAAISYFSMPKNREKYSQEEQKAIWERIRRAAEKFGVEISEDKKKNEEKASMDDKEKEVKETPEEEKKETPEEQKKEKEEGVEKDMKAEYEAMKASLADISEKLEKATREKAEVESKLQATETQLTEATNTIKAHESVIRDHRVSELRAKLVGSILDEDEFAAKQDVLLGLPADAIELMTRNVKKEEKPLGRLNLAASETKDDAWVIC